MTSYPEHPEPIMYDYMKPGNPVMEDRVKRPNAVSVTFTEDGEWHDFCCATQPVHSIRFDDGSEWDVFNGWRERAIVTHAKSDGRLRHELEQCEELLGKLYNVIGPDAWPKTSGNSWQEIVQTRRNSINSVLKP